MVTLQETAAKFNNHLHVSHTGGRLSSDSGLTLVNEFMDAFHFTELSKNFASFNEDRRYWLHDNHKILKQLFFRLSLAIKPIYQRISYNTIRYYKLFQLIQYGLRNLLSSIFRSNYGTNDRRFPDTQSNND